MPSVCVEIKTPCKFCGTTLTLNALANEILCHSCQKMNSFPYEYWKKSILESALNDYGELKEGEGQNQTVMTGEYTFTIMYGLQEPRCGKCKTNLDPAHFPDYAQAHKAVCTKCSNEVSVRVPPDEVKSLFTNIQYLIGEDADMIDTNGKGMKTPEAVKPVLFTCPSCGGNLKIDGSDRMVTCSYCESQIYLPDDLWFRIHPAKIVERWYMVLS
jgi:DNA-directed RNA polymerase subunit M/transcription elongation factor TFIIS